MTRPLKPGDRVTATGTVAEKGRVEGVCWVAFEGDDQASRPLPYAALTLIVPAEPPVGSVVVKDGVAWIHALDDAPKFHWMNTVDDSWTQWDDISDGEILFTPEAPDVG